MKTPKEFPGLTKCAFLQVDAINALLKGPVISKAFEETKHFPMDHSLQGELKGSISL